MGRKALLQSNKGFTLVEICVVFVLFSILAAITTVSLVKWTEYSTYSRAEDNAELVYMAARNKIAKLRANNVLSEYESFSKNDRILTTVSYANNSYSENLPDGDLRWACCSLNDYSNYDSIKSVTGKESAVMIFDLISDYIFDKNILNGSIGIEYSASTGIIYKVFYSDRTNICYGSGSGLKLDVKSNRNSNSLSENVIGCYAAEKES